MFFLSHWKRAIGGKNHKTLEQKGEKTKTASIEQTFLTRMRPHYLFEDKGSTMLQAVSRNLRKPVQKQSHSIYLSFSVDDANVRR